jgi:hypothetical protein
MGKTRYVCTAKFELANGKKEGVDFTKDNVLGMLQRREMVCLKCPNGDDAGLWDIMSLNEHRHTYLMRERAQGFSVVQSPGELSGIFSPSQSVAQRDAHGVCPTDDESDADDNKDHHEVIDRDEFSDSDDMSAETASSSDVASVENGAAVQQNFTPPVSKSVLFDNIVEEEGAGREKNVNESKRKDVFKTFGGPCKNPRFSNPETMQARLLALVPQRDPSILKRSNTAVKRDIFSR